jgi:hypothetical protein
LNKRIKNVAGQVTINVHQCRQHHDQDMVKIDMLQQVLRQGEKRIELLEKKDREREKFTLGVRGAGNQ